MASPETRRGEVARGCRAKPGSGRRDSEDAPDVVQGSRQLATVCLYRRGPDCVTPTGLARSRASATTARSPREAAPLSVSSG